MTMPPLPDAGSTDWYAHYSALDSVARNAPDAAEVADLAVAAVQGAIQDGVIEVGAGATTHPGALAALYGGLAQAQTRPVRIVAAGGSTMAGQGSSQTEAAWATRLLRHLQAAYPSGSLTESDVLVLNDVYAAPPTAPGVYLMQRAVSGNTTGNYLDATARQRIAAVAPVAVLHQPISNDWANGVDPATSKANMVAHLDDLNTRITTPCVHILLDTQPRGDVTPVRPFSDYTAVLEELAAERPETVIYLSTGKAFEQLGLPTPDPWDLLGTDITHLTDDGHRLQADLVRQLIRLPGPARQDWVLRDRMSRADGAVGTADTGQTYTAVAGTYTIASNNLVSADAAGLIVADVREGDVDASATIRFTGGTAGAVGLGVRVTGTTGRLLVALDLLSQQIRMFKLISGTNSDAVTPISFPVTTGRDYKARITVKNGVVTGWVDGTRIGPYTLTGPEQTALATATGVGFRHSGGDAGFGISARNLGVKRV